MIPCSNIAAVIRQIDSLPEQSNYDISVAVVAGFFLIARGYNSSQAKIAQSLAKNVQNLVRPYVVVSEGPFVSATEKCERICQGTRRNVYLEPHKLDEGFN
ncbi:hypothetical protein SERLA73DRAFT_136533 [Serpula lacrymans var. lacrymans S7.3]|uniref:Uncharacterized protein n=1 Tax=Serpula lacrymans var. lacrymans (strain S7.3) TaxID=936435 RepID=F8PXQ3_SERL3|nr:hypothetical protein SERLA73DRAFT_136533 [Serpula lacrymans var. lacrymans S7.3]